MEKKEIWIIGGRNSNADRSFEWTNDIPDITNADILILDMSRLPPPPNRATFAIYFPETKWDVPEPPWIKDYVRTWKERVTNNLGPKISGGGHVILLLDHNPASEFMFNSNLFPYKVDIRKTPDRTICYSSKHQFATYLRCAGASNMALTFPPTHEADETLRMRPLDGEDCKITDKSKRIVGASFVADAEDGTPGYLTLLPPYQPFRREEALDAIISVFRDDITKSPPQWAESILMPGVREIYREIYRLEDQIKRTKSKVSRLESQKNDLSSHRKLLYSYGISLNHAVKAAFIKLGFEEIAKVRPYKEDWKMELRSIPTVESVVLEVKGGNARTSIDDLRRCMEWVDDYARQSPPISAKGIFVANQYRWEAYPESKAKRKLFDPEERELAASRGICIIPTHLLFEAVKKVLEGHKPDRDKLEQVIFDTNGVLDSLLMGISYSPA